jgi:hypothetical protein
LGSGIFSINSESADIKLRAYVSESPFINYSHIDGGLQEGEGSGGRFQGSGFRDQVSGIGFQGLGIREYTIVTKEPFAPQDMKNIGGTGFQPVHSGASQRLVDIQIA